MENLPKVLLYLGVGLAGGFAGQKLKMPAGALIGAMLSVLLIKVILKSDWELPKNYKFVIQVMVGVMVGVSFKFSMLSILHKIIIPVLLSSVMLIMSGIIIAFVFHYLGVVDLKTAYLGANPGAMTPLIVMAAESGVNPSVITCFHLVRVIIVVLTAPVIFKLLSNIKSL